MDTLRTTRGMVSVKHGTEGPRNDPYGYSEYEFESSTVKVILHLGLAEWMQITDNNGITFVNEGHDKMVEEWNKLTGVDFFQIEKWMSLVVAMRLKRHKHACRGKVVWKRGYTGESFLMCKECDTVFDTYFNESAVI